MRIIEHSTTPHDLVNSLSHSGTKFKKERCVSQPSSLTHAIQTIGLPIRPGFRIRPTASGRKTSSNRMRGVGIVSSLFALGSILELYCLVTKSFKTNRLSPLVPSHSRTSSANNFHFPLDLFSEPCNN